MTNDYLRVVTDDHGHVSIPRGAVMYEEASIKSTEEVLRSFFLPFIRLICCRIDF
jgi:hypothetical protein